RIMVHRHTRVHHSPPPAPLVVETGSRATRPVSPSPSRIGFAPSIFAAIRPPQEAPLSPHASLASASDPEPSAATRQAEGLAPIRSLLNPQAEVFHSSAPQPPPRYVPPPVYRTGERRPGDLIPETEPQQSGPQQAQNPAPGGQPGFTLSRLPQPPPASRWHLDHDPSPTALIRARGYDAAWLMLDRAPHIRHHLDEVRPTAEFIPLDSHALPPVQRVDGFPDRLNRFRLVFTPPLTRPLVTGTVVLARYPNQSPGGEVVPTEELFRRDGWAYLMAYRVWGREVSPCVV
ncbi:hypothetical protein HDZ31DRAFT_12922, partial [Schizophyllum fasciatum]